VTDAAAAEEQVTVIAPVKVIATVPPDKNVGAFAARQDVVTPSAPQFILTRATVEMVVVATAALEEGILRLELPKKGAPR